MKLFVSNINFNAAEDDLREHFVKAGYIPTRLTLCADHSGKSKGFAFVDMDDQVGDDAIAELDGTEILGRRINVKLARPEKGGRK